MGGLVEGLDHVAVTCPAELEEEVLGWYTDIFELERVSKPSGTRAKGGWFALGDKQLHVQIDEHNPPKVAHFAIAVSDLEATIERLRRAGCHIEQATEIPGRRRFFTRDPAGNRVEVVHHEGER